MRKGECAALRLDDIIWRENILRVDQTLEFQPDKGDDLLGDLLGICNLTITAHYGLIIM